MSAALSNLWICSGLNSLVKGLPVTAFCVLLLNSAPTHHTIAMFQTQLLLLHVVHCDQPPLAADAVNTVAPIYSVCPIRSSSP
jgi:hypothetical protein